MNIDAVDNWELKSNDDDSDENASNKVNSRCFKKFIALIYIPCLSCQMVVNCCEK